MNFLNFSIISIPEAFILAVVFFVAGLTCNMTLIQIQRQINIIITTILGISKAGLI